jgi:hypothetical protein
MIELHMLLAEKLSSIAAVPAFCCLRCPGCPVMPAIHSTGCLGASGCSLELTQHPALNHHLLVVWRTLLPNCTPLLLLLLLLLLLPALHLHHRPSRLHHPRHPARDRLGRGRARHEQRAVPPAAVGPLRHRCLQLHLHVALHAATCVSAPQLPHWGDGPSGLSVVGRSVSCCAREDSSLPVAPASWSADRQRTG